MALALLRRAATEPFTEATAGCVRTFTERAPRLRPAPPEKRKCVVRAASLGEKVLEGRMRGRTEGAVLITAPCFRQSSVRRVRSR
jgi:hypothetical protein